MVILHSSHSLNCHLFGIISNIFRFQFIHHLFRNLFCLITTRNIYKEHRNTFNGESRISYKCTIHRHKNIFSMINVFPYGFRYIYLIHNISSSVSSKYMLPNNRYFPSSYLVISCPIYFSFILQWTEFNSESNLILLFQNSTPFCTRVSFVQIFANIHAKYANFCKYACQICKCCQIYMPSMQKFE